ncbi:hypothetical protein CRE_21234 [Caenorhabditis remanei]|uniref:T20D4.11-like domain-containing protein n=1 Tax=Caenorhabditis remanei TaxID=31234 RepID=E3MF06_CAERE|nr:hypothetical protein CRE_21234 [Caenorhabditis remanei]
MKLYLLIFFSLLQLNNGFFIPPENFQKCGLDESLGVILCIAPVTTLFQDNINLQNITRARGIRIVDECRNATTCLAQYPCVTQVQLDKVFNLLCDTISYFSTDFASCQKKLVAQMPPCMRDAEKNLLNIEKIGHPCDLISKYQPCMQTEITNICGEKYWTPLDTILKKLQKYAHIKCPIIDTEV